MAMCGAGIARPRHKRPPRPPRLRCVARTRLYCGADGSLVDVRSPPSASPELRHAGHGSVPFVYLSAPRGPLGLPWKVAVSVGCGVTILLGVGIWRW